MFICLCTALNTVAIDQVLQDNEETIRKETTLKRKAGVAFRATHEKGGPHRCASCITTIGERIVEKGLHAAEPETAVEIGPCGKDCNSCATQACSIAAP